MFTSDREPRPNAQDPAFDTGGRDPNNPVSVAGISGDRLRSFIERIERLNEEIAALRENFEKQKVEYKGSNPREYARQLDRLILSLEAQYGKAIPVDEAMKLLEKIENDIRAHERSSTSSL